MTAVHQLELLKSLIRSYFSDKLQFDETPEGAKKRMELRLAILELTKNQTEVNA